MHWTAFAVLCAFFLATSDIFAKRAMRCIDEYTVAWGRIVWSAPCVLCIIPFIDIPPTGPSFWTAFAALIPIEMTAVILYAKAIKISPLSITTPFLGLTPMFMIATSYVLLGETPDSTGLLGIVLVSAGAYSLNIREARIGPLAPLKAVSRERGSLLMVIVAFLYSITSILGKICARESSPLFFCLVYVLVMPAVLLPVVITASGIRNVLSSFRNANFVLIGLFYGLMLVCHLQAIVRVEAAYMISVKRMSLLFSIVYGRLVFQEHGFAERFVGGALMMCGIAAITLL